MSNFASAEPLTKTCILHQPDQPELPEFVAFGSMNQNATVKLKYLQEIRDKRLQQPHESVYRMEDICMQIPDRIDKTNVDFIGYHRQCYQNFTNHLDRLTSSDVDQPSTSRSPRKRKSTCYELFSDECIFCDRIQKRNKNKTERCTSFAVFKSTTGTVKEPF